MMNLVMSLKFMLSTFIQRLVALQNRLFPYQPFLPDFVPLVLFVTVTFKKLKRLSPTKAVCLNDVTSFIIKRMFDYFSACT